VDKEPWWKVSPGSALKLKGKMPEHGEPDDLFGCVFVETGPNPEAAVTKYNEKWIILEGELLEKNGDKNQLVVKGKGEVKVLCSFGAAAMDKERMNALEVGRKVKVFGQAAVYKTGNVIYLQPVSDDGQGEEARARTPSAPTRLPCSLRGTSVLRWDARASATASGDRGRFCPGPVSRGLPCPRRPPAARPRLRPDRCGWR
jgi:hypothetical protein